MSVNPKFQILIITYDGKESEKVYIHIYIYEYIQLHYFVVHLKHCKSTILQFKKKLQIR